MISVQRELTDETQTEALARWVAGLLRPGFRIELIGPLGSGKTTFTRSLLRTLGYRGRVKSPSYAIVEPYDVSNLYFYHFDLYRLKSFDEFLDAGLDELLASQAVSVIEWPEKAQGRLPEPDLRIRLDFASEDSSAGGTAEAEAVTSSARKVRLDVFSEDAKAQLARLLATIDRDAA